MDGFLGTRAPLFPDVVVVALVVVLPALVWGAILAGRGRTRLHHTIMWWTYHVLAVVVVAFVVWNAVAGTHVPALEASWLYRPIYLPLVIGHVIVAVSATVFTGWVTWRARLRRVERPDGELGFDPDEARHHRRTGKLALALLLATSVSGLAIYYFRYVREY